MNDDVVKLLNEIKDILLDIRIELRREPNQGFDYIKPEEINLDSWFDDPGVASPIPNIEF